MAEMDKILKSIINDLTPKERKVLDLVEEGLSTDGIAEALDCEPSTITQDLHRIYWKFGVFFDFKGKRNKRATLIKAWRKIREQYEVKPVSQ